MTHLRRIGCEASGHLVIPQSCVRADVVPLLAGISDQPIERVVPFHDNVGVEASGRGFTVEPCIPHRPVVAIDEVRSIEDFSSCAQLCFCNKPSPFVSTKILTVDRTSTVLSGRSSLSTNP